MDAVHNDLDLITDLLAKAKAKGADAADAILARGTSVTVDYRLGELEKLERSEGQDLGLRVLIGKKQAMVSTSDVAPGALEELLERAIAMARIAPEDPYCGVADPDQLGQPVGDLDLCAPQEVPVETLKEWSKAAEDAARAVPGVTNSEGAGASYGRSQVSLAISNGFATSYAVTRCGMSAAVLAGEGIAMERDYDYTAAVHAEDLRDPADVGRSAGEKAVKRLNPQKAATAQVPVVYDPRAGRGLLRSFAGAISGSSVARGTSFLKDSMGTAIFNPAITVVDDPHRLRGYRSKPIDAEGLANGRRDLVAAGVLQGWVLDLATARQLGLQSTGNASRGVGGPPSPSASNLYIAAGDKSPEELMKDIKSGFYVTETMGFGVNGVTGDYSQGASGYWIENGEIAFPVSELTIAGNLKDMFKAMLPANDLEFLYGTDVPTLVVDGMTVAGK
ncbi:MAG: TldD/PmbA family protein [Magnetospiraceae bacterium]